MDIYIREQINDKYIINKLNGIIKQKKLKISFLLTYKIKLVHV
jgi:hypothetical protein